MEEKEKARLTDPSQLALNTLNLRKIYGNSCCGQTTLAVDGVSLTVNRNEVFALLGVNGAGKTTTFKMLTGEEVPSTGQAWVNGIETLEDTKAVRKIVGYCPQYNALTDLLTVKEHLHLYAAFKGIVNAEAIVEEKMH